MLLASSRGLNKLDSSIGSFSILNLIFFILLNLLIVSVEAPLMFKIGGTVSIGTLYSCKLCVKDSIYDELRVSLSLCMSGGSLSYDEFFYKFLYFLIMPAFSSFCMFSSCRIMSFCLSISRLIAC